MADRNEATVWACVAGEGRGQTPETVWRLLICTDGTALRTLTFVSGDGIVRPLF